MYREYCNLRWNRRAVAPPRTRRRLSPCRLPGEVIEGLRAPDRKWSMEAHGTWGSNWRDVVVTILALTRENACLLSRVPFDLLFEILDHLYVLPSLVPDAKPTRLCDDFHLSKKEHSFVACVGRRLLLPSARRGVVMFTRSGSLVRNVKFPQSCAAAATDGDFIFAADATRPFVIVARASNCQFVEEFHTEVEPTCLAAAGGLVFVGSRPRNCVRVFRQDGTPVFRISARSDDEPHGFAWPEGIAAYHDEMFVCDQDRRVSVYRVQDGAFLRSFFVAGRPTGISVRADHIFVSTTDSDGVTVFDTEGVRKAQLRLGTPHANPRGVCVSEEGILYVVCRGGVECCTVFGVPGNDDVPQDV